MAWGKVREKICDEGIHVTNSIFNDKYSSVRVKKTNTTELETKIITGNTDEEHRNLIIE